MEGILYFADYAKLVVPNGVTLTLDTAAYFNDAQLVVQEGGKLVSNMSLTFNAPQAGIGGAVIVGKLTNNGMLWVNEGATVNINGTAVSDCAAIHVGFGGSGKIGISCIASSFLCNWRSKYDDCLHGRRRLQIYGRHFGARHRKPCIVR
jgi:hypothetical protein